MFLAIAYEAIAQDHSARETTSLATPLLSYGERKEPSAQLGGACGSRQLREVSVAYSGVAEEKAEASFDKMISQQLVRHLQSIEVARVVSFLLSDDALLVRGQAVNADAGETPY